MHIGLIGGIGPAATEFYYRGLVRASANASVAFEMTIAQADINELFRNLGTGDAEKQAQVFCRHVEQLAGAGAEVAAVTSIAGSFCIRELEKISPLPLSNVLTAVNDELQRRDFSRVGLLGSKMAMETGLYGAISGVELVLPDINDLDTVGREYLAMAIAQYATDEQRDLLFRVGADMCKQGGAEIIVLAGTDLFLAFDGAEPEFKYLDCAALHIEAFSVLAVEDSDTGS